MSKFHIRIISLLSTILLIWFVFSINSNNIDISTAILIFRVVFIMLFCFYSIMLTDDLKEIISIKYKIIETEYNIKVRYLTSWWLFIPYWKPIDENTNSYECENVFGGKSNSYYTSEVIYKNNEEVISAINKHKTLIKNNRDNWFKYNKKEIKNIKYL